MRGGCRQGLKLCPAPCRRLPSAPCSANGDWLRIGLKVQLLEGEGPGGGGSSRGGGASAKQATYWRRVHA